MLTGKKITIVGAGHIAGALLGGILRGNLTKAQDVTLTRRTPEALEELKKRWKVNTSTDNRAAVKTADIVILTVKPQGAKAVLSEIAGSVHKGQLIISAMAGIKTEAIVKELKRPVAVVRAMPNTPVFVDEGACAIAAGEHASDKDLQTAEAIFKAVGKVEILPESLIDAVTGLSGSGPAYIYMIIEALTDGGVKMGIPRAVAVRLAAQTVYGAAKMVIETGKHPAILKDEVATPGGTTIAAIHELESHGLRTVLMDAVQTATRRSKELSSLFD
jgi:pyrroline-5-carboxylate reductase